MKDNSTRTANRRALLWLAFCLLTWSDVSLPTDTDAAPVIRYVPDSTVKVEQLIGNEDKERHQPTRGQTVTRYQ